MYEHQFNQDRIKSITSQMYKSDHKHNFYKFARTKKNSSHLETSSDRLLESTPNISFPLHSTYSYSVGQFKFRMPPVFVSYRRCAYSA